MLCAGVRVRDRHLRGLYLSAALRGCEALMAGLAAARLEHPRRALRVAAAALTLDEVPGTGWWVAFRLPPGAYATMVLRELFDLRDASAGC